MAVQATSDTISTGGPAETSASSATLHVEVWGATDVGQEREGNEDSIYPDSSGKGFTYNPKPDTLARLGRLLIVADGVGGAQAGSEASQWAIRRAVERYYESSGADLAVVVRNAVAHANASLTQYLQSTGTTDAGCTMAAAVIHQGKLYTANVGDSRVYLIRDGKIYQQTRDHTLTQAKLDRGLITPEQALSDSGSSVLTRSLGAVASVEVDVFRPVDLFPGDVVLLCSDGLYDMLPDAEIARLALNGNPARMAQRMIAEANRKGGFDNISVIIAQLGGKPKAAPAAGAFAEDLQKLPQERKRLLTILAAVTVVVVLIVSAIIGWSLIGNGNGRADPTPRPTLQQSGDNEELVVTEETPEPITTEAAGPGEATETLPPTSTPKPTSTTEPTNTRVPPTRTPTATPTLEPTATETPTSEPTDDGGSGEPTETPRPDR
ncbi:MAG: serine/threonine-protein phosphatase [Anaerolineae bacterium]|nr:serine/threonine-protein phosphatase [Anaerolineae bacterium]